MNESFVKIENSKLPPRLLLLVGQFILDFSKGELLIAETIFLHSFSSIKEYSEQNNSLIANEYFASLRALNLQSRLEKLKKLGIDISNLKELAEFRHALAHGYVYEKEGSLFLRKPTKIGYEIKIDEGLLEQEIKSLDKSLRELIEAVEKLGYKIKID